MSLNRSLEGVRVLDFSQVGAGPCCGMLLGDMGADVIKVEAPGGDLGRKLGPPWQKGESVVSMSFNRNKRSIVLDLKKPEGVATARYVEQTLEDLTPAMSSSAPSTPPSTTKTRARHLDKICHQIAFADLQKYCDDVIAGGIRGRAVVTIRL